MPDLVDQAISRDRFAPYLRAAGFDDDRALQLYLWNLQIGAAFYPLLASVEVALRNRVLVRLEAAYGGQWWTDSVLLAELGGPGKGIVKRAEGKLNSAGFVPTSGRMTAELTFGFWVNMMLVKYERSLWTPVHSHFPDLPPKVDRAALYLKCETIRTLRNRISHHEPLLSANLSQSYSDAVTLLSWLSHAKALWLRPHLQVMAVLRARP